MNEKIEELSKLATEDILGVKILNKEKFAELIIEECAACCGSQADKKNIRKRFGLSIESNIQYQSPPVHSSITSQYTREYNIPK
jgi:nucleoside diphosphate kinase